MKKKKIIAGIFILILLASNVFFVYQSIYQSKKPNYQVIIGAPYKSGDGEHTWDYRKSSPLKNRKDVALLLDALTSYETIQKPEIADRFPDANIMWHDESYPAGGVSGSVAWLDGDFIIFASGYPEEPGTVYKKSYCTPELKKIIENQIKLYKELHESEIK